MATDDDTIAACAWLTMTYMDTGGVVRVVEIPEGNKIRVVIEETRPSSTYMVGAEVDLMAISPQRLTSLFDRGLKVTVEARAAAGSDTLLRIYGRG